MDMKYESMHKLIEQDYEILEHKLAQVKQAINLLPLKCREIFLLCKMDGRSYKEVAKELNISVKTVENQMGKALKIIRDSIDTKVLNLFLLINKFKR